jgi:hypothetical protein
MAVNHAPVTSSFIESVGHDGTTLEVKTKAGKTYVCHDCTPDEHAKLIGAESIGRAWNQMFKGRMRLIAAEDPNDVD